MFAKIKTNGATDILIYIPSEGSEKSLPSLVKLLEHNAVFVLDSYSELTVVKPEMSILLGDTLEVNKGYGSDVTTLKVSVPGSEYVAEGFVHATPDVFISNKKQVEALEKKITTLTTENKYLNEKVAQLQAQSVTAED
jgi:hypothetical protein